MLANGKCLVVGANGFIGSHMVDELVRHGYKVAAFDRYSSPPKFRDSPQIEVIKGDILFEPDLVSALQGVDCVFYSFSATTPFTSESDPYSDIRLNLEHCVSFFDACAENNIKKVIYLSSGGAVYGPTAEEKAATETDLPLPVSPYGICKLAVEHYLAYFSRKAGLPYLIFRVGNPYGPRQVLKHSQGVIPAFIEKIRNHESITVYGDGSASRDYIYISDAVKMMVTAFENESHYNLYNIGSGQQVTLNDIIDVLRHHLDEEISVEYRPEPKTFAKKARISIERFKSEYGEMGGTPLSEGIGLLLEHHS